MDYLGEVFVLFYTGAGTSYTTYTALKENLKVKMFSARKREEGRLINRKTSKSLIFKRRTGKCALFQSV